MSSSCVSVQERCLQSKARKRPSFSALYSALRNGTAVQVEVVSIDVL